jgi:hypothetical protein
MVIAQRGAATKFEPTAAVTTVTNSVPTGVVDGDQLLWVVSGTSVTAPTTPAGWTLEKSLGASGNSTHIYRRTASSEPASYNMTVTSARWSGVMVAYSGVDTSSPIDVATPTGVIGTTAFACPAITPVTVGAVVLGVGGSRVGSGVTSGAITSTNTTIAGTATTKAAAAANAVVGLGHSAAWASGSFTPALATSVASTITHGLTVALRPVTVATVTGTLTAAPAFSGVSVEVEVVSAALTAAPAFSASSREVEVTLGTLTANPVFSGLAAEVEVIAGTLTAGPAFAAAALEVEVTAGTLTAAPAFSATAAVVATTITVDIGDDWSQTWTLGQDPDDDEVKNVTGAILDNLTASWSAPDAMTQPTPTVLAFGVYVPATAPAPPTVEQGTAVHVLITPPGWVAGTEYAPVLEFYGRISDGDAVPWAEGLKYQLNAADPLAELGESQVGAEDWPQENMFERVNRIGRAMVELGHGPLITPWYTDDEWTNLLAGVPAVGTPEYMELFRRKVPASDSQGFAAYPTMPQRPGEGAPTLDMLTAFINAPGAKWMF